MRSVSTYTSLKRKLVLSVLGIWLIAIFLLTWAAAEDFLRQLEDGSISWLQVLASIEQEEDMLPGQLAYETLDEFRFGHLFLSARPLLPFFLPQSPSSYGSDDWIWGKWYLMYGFQTAAGLFDPQGEPLLLSSRDYLFFPYSNTPNGEIVGYAYADLSALEGGEALADRFINTSPLGDYFPFNLQDLRLTGIFQGSRFIPSRISSTNGTVFFSAQDQPDEAVTVYPSQRLTGYNFSSGPGFLYRGQFLDSAAALLTDPKAESTRNLFSAVILRRIEKPHGQLVFAVQTSPLLYAVLRLLPMYLVSLLLVAVLLTQLLKRIRQELIFPLEVINRSFEQNRTELSEYAQSPLTELQALAVNFEQAQQDRHRTRNQLQQLSTSLDYARSAEERRRKMVSAIAHELKTPLAVIHSYTEGLQSHIAAEKRERYLSVILEETESMDAMVQALLDYSRLEAGRVTLRPETVDLTGLITEILEKLSDATPDRQLQTDLRPIQITADRDRICQVITNYLENAFKYTAPGGMISLALTQKEGFVRFTIANEAPPLTPEETELVWDFFYRSDAARDRSGAGLGLAISKAIIELHSGSVGCRNIPGGVEFSFLLPL